MKQIEYFGEGSIKNLKEILAKENPSTIFLVTGKKSYEFCGAEKILDDILKDYKVIQFDNFQANPTIENVEHGLKLFRENKIDLIIAVGGGSPMDIAKSISILDSQQGDIKNFITAEKQLERARHSLVAIPTTSGSGSEATQYAVVNIGKTKYSLQHESLLPNYSIVDPELTYNLPAKITASTGIDALAQGIESYWSIHSTDESKKYSIETIKLALNNLEKAVNQSDKSARKAMSRASNLSGKAINITRTTACHAISYPITTYFNVPHGHAVGLTLGSILVYNSRVSDKDVLDQRGVEYVKKTISGLVELLGCKDVEEASQTITNLMKGIGLKTRLIDLGIKVEQDRELIVEYGFSPNRVKNNPRQLTQDNLRIILNRL